MTLGCTGPGDVPTYADDPAVDAAVRLTAAASGFPPFDTPLPDGPTPDWWIEGYRCAASGLEATIVATLEADR